MCVEQEESVRKHIKQLYRVVLINMVRITVLGVSCVGMYLHVCTCVHNFPV